MRALRSEIVEKTNLLWRGESLDEFLHCPGPMCVEGYLHKGLLLRGLFQDLRRDTRA